jgi:hypothetical protein
MAVQGNEFETRTADASWPTEVNMIISAMEAGGSVEDKREIPRMLFRAKAFLKLFVDRQESKGRALYLRDANERSLGFVTQHRLPLGYGGVIQVCPPLKAGQVFELGCTVIRCRQVADGWFEGCVSLNRECEAFAPEEVGLGDIQ